MPVASQPLGLRPTTAAAVVSNGGGIDADLMLGGGEKDDLDEDYDHRGNMGDGRPTTAGAMLQYGSRAAPANNGGGTWGYSRQADGSGQVPSLMKTTSAGIADYGQDGGANRTGQRPHTAHAGRAGFPSHQMAPSPGYAMNDPKAMGYADQDVSYAMSIQKTVLISIFCRRVIRM